MKHTISLAVALGAVWMLWSGHTEPFLLLLGVLSILAVVGICWRMQIIDGESAPIQLGIRPFVAYLPWLIKEIVVANLDVTRRVLAKEMPIAPTVIKIQTHQRTDLGRVIFANSITLTPGTVSVTMSGDEITVHALSPTEAEHDTECAADMNRRVVQLEGS
ncbi:MAG: Na+/H+ antiporter subunit E [Planctomycetales bacterium]|nr:Na+/H+ antiporter subunit E [Planctomycetales bacterium]